MMNKKNKANLNGTIGSLLIATMVVIEVLSQTIFAAFALPIKPTPNSISQSLLLVSSMVLKLVHI